MNDVEQYLLLFFESVAKKDKQQLNNLKQSNCFDVGQEYWKFTLPVLHSFLQNQEKIFKDINYKQFRQLIFNSPINQKISSYGAKIVIQTNNKKVDTSHYSLVWS